VRNWERAIRDEWAAFRDRPGVWTDALAAGLEAYVRAQPMLRDALDLVAEDNPRAMLPMLLDHLALNLGDRDPEQDHDDVERYCEEVNTAWDVYWHGCIGQGYNPYSDCTCCGSPHDAVEYREYLNGLSRDGDDWTTCPCCYVNVRQAWLSGSTVEAIHPRYQALHYSWEESCCSRRRRGKLNCYCEQEVNTTC
jgi:hypothetical protein